MQGSAWSPLADQPFGCHAAYNKVAVLDKPILILASEIKPIEESAWGSTDAWLKTLGEFKSTALGLILPLELPGRYGRRGELWGVELLRWLRWSAPEPIRFIPALAVAWQPLEMILRAKHEPLLVSRGAWFARLPDVMDGNPSDQECFIVQVRTDPERLKISRADLELLAGGTAGEAARLTHHDLANEGYSAWRLWAGYLEALRQASYGKKNTQPAKNKLAWADKVQFPWLDELKQRMRQPAFQQFQILRRSTAPPKYPKIENAVELVRDHAKEGLPGVLRVLLVDDEFDKGLADVLLKILFGNVEFTYSLPDGSEQVYCAPGADPSKGKWARFVCVKNTQAAAHWLRLWGELKVLPPASAPSYTQWLVAWADRIGKHVHHLNREDIKHALTFPGADGTPPLDATEARPARPVTVILLDLRLGRGEPEASYSPEDFESLRFRNAVKEDRPDLPVIVLTASRQALNYVAAMEGAGPQDGWLTKEAPDVPVDDENSARSVHYLLSRLHVFSTMREWYRPELGWNSGQLRKFAAFWSRPDRDELLKTAREAATDILSLAKSSSITVPRTKVADPPVRILGYVKRRQAWSHPIVPLLVSRKVALACLLYTADWSHGGPVWNPQAFHEILPQDELTKRLTKVSAIYDVVNFHRDLWIPGRASPVTRLLREEYEWLLAQDYGQHNDQCRRFLNNLLQSTEAST